MCSTFYFFVKPFVPFCEMFVVRQMVEQAEADSILPLGMLLIRPIVRCVRDLWVHTVDVWLASYNCNAHPDHHDLLFVNVDIPLVS